MIEAPLRSSQTVDSSTRTKVLPAEQGVRLQAAVRLQRAWRRQLAIYLHYGAELFCMRDTSFARHGSLSFVNSIEARSKKASFLAFSDTTSAAFLLHFITRQWKLHPPECLFTIVGSAQDFQLSSMLQSVFSEGLASAATSCRAWVITGILPNVSSRLIHC